MLRTRLKGGYDVVIAGARCAGASTAMLLAKAGLDVLVVDPLPRGRDTLSTHVLMRGGVVQLHRWGLLDAVHEAGTPPIEVTTFDYGDETVVIPIKPKKGVSALYAPRRTVLDPILVEAAERAGADVVHGLSLVGLERDAQGRVRGARVAGADRVQQTVAAALVVGADGMRSRVARMVGAQLEHQAAHATAVIYGYWRGVGRTDNRWTFRPGLGTGSIPTSDDATCVFASMTPEAFAQGRAAGLSETFHRAIRRADPVLAELLGEDVRAGPLRAFPGATGFLRRPVGPGWALVGDAGYFRDPLTAHGITDALRDAELLARAYTEGGHAALPEYHEARNLAARGVMACTDRIASLAWSMDEVKALHRELSREMTSAMEVQLGTPAG